MMNRIPRALVVLAVPLALIACAGNRQGGIANETTSGSKEESKPLTAQPWEPTAVDFGPLVTSQQPSLPQAQEMAEAILQGDAASRLQAASSRLPSILEGGAIRYFMVHGRQPASPTELAEFIFMQPAPDLIADVEALLSARSVQGDPIAAQPNVRFELQATAAGLELRRPMLIEGEWKIRQDLPLVGRSSKFLPSAGQPSLSEKAPPVEPLSTRHFNRTKTPYAAWAIQHGYRDSANSPHDARLAEAESQLMWYLANAADNTGQLADSIDALRNQTGLEIINLRPSDPGAAQLQLDWDGAQAYRLRTTYSSGVTVDTVEFYTQVGVIGSSWREMPTSYYEQYVTGRTWQSLGAWQLASPDEATFQLPGT